MRVWFSGHSSPLWAAPWFQANSTPASSPAPQVPSRRSPRCHLRAILASDGVAVFGVLHKRHVHADQGSPVGSYHLASDERHQAERQRNTSLSHAQENKEAGGRVPSPSPLPLPRLPTPRTPTLPGLVWSLRPGGDFQR